MNDLIGKFEMNDLVGKLVNVTKVDNNDIKLFGKVTRETEKFVVIFPLDRLTRHDLRFNRNEWNFEEVSE